MTIIDGDALLVERVVGGVDSVEICWREPGALLCIRLVDGEFEPGAIAGAEGLGSEFFADADGVLTELELNVPFPIVDFLPDEEFGPILDQIRQRASSGSLRLRQTTRRAILPTAAWVLELPGPMLIDFANHPILPVSAFATSTETTDWVRLAPGVIAGVDQFGSLGPVLIDDVLRRMDVFGVVVDGAVEPELAGPFATVQTAFLRDPEPSVFRALMRDVPNQLPKSASKDVREVLFELIDGCERELIAHDVE